MNDYQPSDDDAIASIDLVEIYARAKPMFVPALLFGLACAVTAFFYSQSLDKLYSSTAKFTIQDNSSSNASSIGGLVSGIGGTKTGTGEAGLARDKIMSRDFILDLFPLTDINEDLFFIGTGERPILLSLLLSPKDPKPEEVLEEIVRTYRTNVQVDDSSSNGVIDLRVRHSDPVRAAFIANVIVNTHIKNVEDKSIESDQREVSLMNNRLLAAQEAFDEALEASRIFTLENSVQLDDELSVNSVNLTRLRREQSRIDGIIAGVEYVDELRTTDRSGFFNLDEFARQHPGAFSPIKAALGLRGVDTAPFPSARQLENLKNSTLQERIQLQRRLGILEREAENNVESAGQFASLQRDIEVRRRIYNSLVTQFEARDLSAELRSNSVEIIQNAAVPISPSAPRILFITLIACAVGILTMLLAGLFRAYRSGRFYTKNSIEKAFGMPAHASNIAQAVGPKLLRPKQLSKFTTRTSNPEFLDFIVNSKENSAHRTCIASIPDTVVGYNLAIILGKSLYGADHKIAIVNLTRKKNNSIKNLTEENGIFILYKEEVNVKFFHWISSSEKTAMTVTEAFAAIEAEFDRTVTIAAPLRWGGLINKAAMRRADHVIMLTQKAKTTKNDAEWAARVRASVPDSALVSLLVV